MIEKMVSSFLANKIKGIITICGLITALFGVVSGTWTGLMWVDARYAHAAETEQKLQDVTKDFNKKFGWIQKNQLETQRQQYEDKIFELNTKQNKTQSDNALIERYRERMRAIDAQLANMVKSQTSDSSTN